MIYSIGEIKERVLPIAAKYHLNAVYLFGSYARGDATETSDVDILIDRTDSSIKGLFDLGGLYNDLCESMGKEVDLVTTQTLEQDSTRQRTPWFVENVKREMLKLYE